MEKETHYHPDEHDTYEPLMEVFGCEPSVVHNEDRVSTDQVLEENQPMSLLSDYLNG